MTDGNVVVDSNIFSSPSSPYYNPFYYLSALLLQNTEYEREKPTNENVKWKCVEIAAHIFDIIFHTRNEDTTFYIAFLHKFTEYFENTGNVSLSTVAEFYAPHVQLFLPQQPTQNNPNGNDNTNEPATTEVNNTVNTNDAATEQQPVRKRQRINTTTKKPTTTTTDTTSTRKKRGNNQKEQEGEEETNMSNVFPTTNRGPNGFAGMIRRSGKVSKNSPDPDKVEKFVNDNCSTARNLTENHFEEYGNLIGLDLVLARLPD